MRFEMDEVGRHRIVGKTHAGEWAAYEGISTLEEDGRLYIAVTDYLGGVLPPETVLEVTPVSK